MTTRSSRTVASTKSSAKTVAHREGPAKAKKPFNVAAPEPKPATPAAAFAQTAPQMRALAEADVLRVNAPVWAIVSIVYAAFPKIIALRQDIIDNFPKVDVTVIDSLPRLAMALDDADAAYTAATTTPTELPLVYEAALARRDAFLAEVRALIARGLLAPEAIASVTGATGYKKVGPDLLVLVHAVRAVWAQIQGKTGITAAELDATEALHVSLLSLSATRDDTSDTDAAKVASDDRNRVFTLLSKAYRLARKCVVFLRDEAGDAEEIAPALYVGGTRKAASDEPAPAPPTAPVATPTTAPVSVAVAGLPAVDGPHLAGMPGGSPFVK